MSDGVFHAYIALLVVSGLTLSVLAVRGFGLSTTARVVDGLFSVGFLGYAIYLVVGDPATVRVFGYAFAAPVLAVIHVLRAHKAARAAGPSSFAPASGGYGGGFAPVVPPPPYHPAAGNSLYSASFPGAPHPGALPPGPDPSWFPGAPPAAPASPHQGFPGQAQTAYPPAFPAYPPPVHGFSPETARAGNPQPTDAAHGYPAGGYPAGGYPSSPAAGGEYEAHPQGPQSSTPGEWPPRRP
ncbi:hypothetical protein [Actinoplanes subtropicus]|uniref:hypothetical protein n=1 Tax=Actinoplanes subtropicus TaxID=543632 RepID=UPI0004C36137|nr:hypothetical protein [Actinoplanes subtropicus]